MSSNRSEILRAMFDSTGKGLEIGPSHNPLMPKASGFDVEILDYLDADGLRKKYSDAGVDVSAVEHVDFVSDGRSMTEVIGDRQRYDWIVASHVIEHVPDLVSFLRDCEALLKPNGSLVLAVPDKRCCFDVLRPVSSVGQVLQAYVDQRIRPSPGVIFDDIAYARKSEGRTGWGLHDHLILEQVRPIEDAWSYFEKARRSNEYIDMHCWVFVPSSFQLIIRALSNHGLIALHEQNFRVGGGEFYAVLSPSALLQTVDLGELALSARDEEREAITRELLESSTKHEGELERLRATVASQRLDLDSIAGEFSRIKASRSWRLTAPLRALHSRILRMRM